MERSIDLLTRPLPPFDERLPYGAYASQFGELRLPKGPGPHPLIVAIHGGWWRSEHGLETHAHQCAALTREGFATWNIEYRRLGEDGGGWPGTLHDVSAAIDFVTSIASTYRLDLARVTTVGFSAGGHLSLWAAARHRYAMRAAQTMSRPVVLRGAVALAGAVDLIGCADLNLSGGIVAEFLQGSPQRQQSRYVQCSPLELLPLGIRHTLVHGTDDMSIPYQISENYHREAVRRGDKCKLILLPHTQHFELIDPLAPCWPRVLKAIRAVA